MRLALALLLTFTALAQETPEIRGTVTEAGSNIPLPGVEITVYEMAANDAKLVGTTFTDARGVYALKLPRVGLYRFEAKEPGYLPRQNAAGEFSRTQLRLTAERPRMDLNLTFMRPASLTGRVLDEDRQPVADLPVYVQQAGAATILSTGRMATTNEDGVFTAFGLTPGSYVVRIARQTVDTLIVTDDSDADFKTVEHDIETSFWPGGLEDPSAVVPIQIQSGALSSIGTISIRSAPYYKVRFTYDGECGAGEEWHYALMNSAGTAPHRTEIAACRTKFLIHDVEPGSYTLAVWTGQENTRWSLTPLVLTNENIEAALRFSSSATLTLRLVTPGEMSKPSLPNVRIQMLPEDAPSAPQLLQREADGLFVARNVPWLRHSIQVRGLPSTHYVKEFRLIGQVIPDNVVSVFSGMELDIVLDDHPATITGKIPNYGREEGPMAALTNRITLQREPARTGDIPVTSSLAADGSFGFSGLAPGEYRIQFEKSAPGGQLVKVGRGETKTVEVKAQ